MTNERRLGACRTSDVPRGETTTDKTGLSEHEDSVSPGISPSAERTEDLARIKREVCSQRFADGLERRAVGPGIGYQQDQALHAAIADLPVFAAQQRLLITQSRFRGDPTLAPSTRAKRSHARRSPEIGIGCSRCQVTEGVAATRRSMSRIWPTSRTGAPVGKVRMERSRPKTWQMDDSSTRSIVRAFALSIRQSREREIPTSIDSLVNDRPRPMRASWIASASSRTRRSPRR